MAFLIRIPCANGQRIEIDLQQGESVFVLGANGTGKSSLMHQTFTLNQKVARRISAHRQTWLTSNTLMFSPDQKRKSESRIRGEDAQAHSRWKDDHSATRAGLAIYDLIDAENVRARAITGAVDGGDMDLAKTLSRRDAPIKVINDLLRLSNIPVSIAVQRNEEVVASKAGSPPYSIAELSDGERNALLIAADVLTAVPDTLLIIDEPERHLHRSIISPLLTLLFSHRPDCAFVVSTHEVMLPVDNPNARTLLLRGCHYQGSQAIHWDADVLQPDVVLDETLKADILGARRTALFVEGGNHSLDKPLYSLVFPGVTVVAKASCRDVEHAVSGIREAEALHWVKAFGLIDGDQRPPEDLSELSRRGVYAVPFIALEAIYYHPEMQARVANRHASVTGDDAPGRLADAIAAALASIKAHGRRMAERIAETTVRARLLRQLPDRRDVAARRPITLSVDPAEIVDGEFERLCTCLDRGDFESLICRYPIRETPALVEIARRLGFQGRDQYEGAVRKLVLDDAEALRWVRSLFGDLVCAMASTVSVPQGD